MKIETIKNKLKKKLLKNGSIALVLGIIYFGVAYYNSSSKAQIETTNNEIYALRNEMFQKEDDFKEAEKNLKLFLKIPKKALPTDKGYNAGYMRIKELMPVFEELKNLYKFKKLDLDVKEITPSVKVTGNDFDTFEGEMDIVFSGVSDEYVFSFINDLSFRLPGQMELLRLNIIKTAEIDSEAVRKYKDDNNFYFVNGVIKLSWFTFKNKVNEN